MTRSVFVRIVCGIDGSPESVEAVRQADCLLDPDGTLLLVAVVDPFSAVHPRLSPTAIHAGRHALKEVERLAEAAGAALEEARGAVTHARRVETLAIDGTAATGLLDAVEAQDASLLALGTHGVGRAAGTILGSVVTRVLRQAPCPVLVARTRATGRWSPDIVVLGDDGSPPAAFARDVCETLTDRLGGELRVVTVTEGRPGARLVEASFGADLLVVGSRSEHHLLGLGSVSEHVAHRAGCSVLVTRRPQPVAD
jgi:nucleotide-binding universal stress UspA family protein